MSLLVAVDLSDNSSKVIKATEKIAKMMHSSVYLLHVAEPNPDFVGYGVGPETVRNQVAHEFHQQHAAMQEYSKQLRESNIDCKSMLIQGATVETVLAEAKKRDVELIVVGSHGHGALYDILIGSISAGIIKKSKIPVMIIPMRD